MDVAVVGGGPWGRALAIGAHRNKKVLLITRRRPSDLPGEIETSSEMADAAKARLLILAVPSIVLRETARRLGDHLDGSHYIVHGIRGLPHMQTVSAVLTEETPVRRIGALGGPAVAEDIAAGTKSVLVAGSRFTEVLTATTEAFGGPNLRVYPTRDLQGVEWASALVGCLAVAVGFARGLSTNAGLLAAFICRSMGEAARLAEAAGGNARTLLGLSGYGDLLACIEQPSRAEVRLGRAIASGQSLENALQTLGERVEAIELIPEVVAWAASHKVRAPIFAALASGIVEGKSPAQILDQLMTLPIEEQA